MTTLEILVRLAAPLAVLISISISAYFVMKQAKANYSMTLRNKALSYSLYANEHLRDARMCIEAALGPLFDIKEPIPMSVLHEKSKLTEDGGSNQLITSIMTILAHWENMGLAIDSKIADEDVCFEMVASTLNQHVKIFRNFIENRREKNDRIYYHLTALKRRWETRLSNVKIYEFQPVFEPPMKSDSDTSVGHK